MAKIILGQPPKSFKRTVSFKQVDGSPGAIEVGYKYRTRAEFGKFVDEIRAQAKAEDEAMFDKINAQAAAGEPIEPLTHTQMLAKESAINVLSVMGCIEGWDLDVKLEEIAVAQLANEVPAAITAIIAEYRTSILTGGSDSRFL